MPIEIINDGIPFKSGNALQMPYLSSINSSIDSHENSSAKMDDDIRRVRTLPIPQNLFLLGLQHKSTFESEEEHKEVRVESASQFSLNNEFWIDALIKSEQEQSMHTK